MALAHPKLIEDGLAAYENLLLKLADVPTSFAHARISIVGYKCS
jgi:hypothetical protein